MTTDHDDPGATHYDPVESNAICHTECAIAIIVALRVLVSPAAEQAMRDLKADNAALRKDAERLKKELEQCQQSR